MASNQANARLSGLVLVKRTASGGLGLFRPSKVASLPCWPSLTIAQRYVASRIVDLLGFIPKQIEALSILKIEKSTDKVITNALLQLVSAKDGNDFRRMVVRVNNMSAPQRSLMEYYFNFPWAERYHTELDELESLKMDYGLMSQLREALSARGAPDKDKPSLRNLYQTLSEHPQDALSEMMAYHGHCC